MRQHESDNPLVNKKAVVAKLLVSLMLMTTGVASQPQQGGLEDPSWLKEFVHKRIVYSVPGLG